MKKLFTFLALSLPALAACAQGSAIYDSTTAAASAPMANALIHRLKTNDQVLPRWAIDLNFRLGALSRTMELIDLKAAYAPNHNLNSSYVTPVFSNGTSLGGDIELGYFFNRRHTIGAAIGLQYMHYTGNVTMDTLYADYEATDDYQATDNSKGRTYRQIIYSNGPLREDVRITHINIPLLLKLKHQFGRPEKPSNFGITADLGPVFGIYNQTEATASGNFSYEAIYKLSPDKHSVVSGFDDGTPPNAEGLSWVITKQEYSKDNRNAAELLDALRRQPGEGLNVGLNKTLAPSQRTQSANYNAISIGAMIQAGVSYQLSYHVTFLLGGYYMYQQYQNTGADRYRPTEKVMDEGGTLYGSYQPLTGGTRKSEYTSYGVHAGFRIFFGEQRDVDGDGIADVRDRCKLDYGEARFGGCPDSDHDNVPDAEDDCPSIPGPEQTNGCPDDDHDGVPNKVDKCPYEYGELRDGCPISAGARNALVDTTLLDSNNYVLPPQIVLQTDVLYFGFNRSDIADSVAKVLDYAVNVLNKESRVVIYISGYTDDIGDAKSNIVLSYHRAKSAMSYLMSKGISESRIIIGGYGMENPSGPNNNEQNRAKNRRIEMKLLLPL